MASYTQVFAHAGLSVSQFCLLVPNSVPAATMLYYHRYDTALTEHVYSYDGTTRTDLGDKSDWNDENICGMTYFKGDLYIMTRRDVGENYRASVWRWDGGTTWTKVLDPVGGTGYGPIATFSGDSSNQLNSDSSWMVAFDASTPSIMLATADGTSWSLHSLQSGYPVRGYGMKFGLAYGEMLLADENNRVHEYTGSTTWSALGSSDPGAANDFAGRGQVYSWFTAGGTLYRSSDWGDALVAVAGGTSHLGWVSRAAPELTTFYDNNDVYFYNYGTGDYDLDGADPTGWSLSQGNIVMGGYLYVLTTTGLWMRDDPILRQDYAPSAASGSAPRSMDVSADDYYLHVGALFGGNPVLLRLLADLSADPIEAYAPGAGTAIGVKCGDENDEWVWIGGDFGTPLVRLSIDDGITWTTKDPGTWGGVALPFVVGSWWDNLFLVPTDTDDDLHETEDGGLNWTTLNAGLPFDVGGMDRLDINLDEIVIGSDAGRDIQYSPNNAAAFEDVSDLGMSNLAITDVIVG